MSDNIASCSLYLLFVTLYVTMLRDYARVSNEFVNTTVSGRISKWRIIDFHRGRDFKIAFRAIFKKVFRHRIFISHRDASLYIYNIHTFRINLIE